MTTMRQLDCRRADRRPAARGDGIGGVLSSGLARTKSERLRAISNFGPLLAGVFQKLEMARAGRNGVTAR